MIEANQYRSMGVLRIAAYSGTVFVCLLAVGFLDCGKVVHGLIALAGLVLGLGAVVSFYRLSGAVENRQFNSERFAAALSVGLLSAVVIAVNLERLGTPVPSQIADASLSIDEAVPPKVDSASSIPDSEESAKRIAQTDEKPKEPTAPTAPTTPQMPAPLAKKADAMLIEADKLAKAGKQEEAEPLLIQVLEMMDTHAPRDLPQRGQVVSTLARLLFTIGKRGEGIDTIDQHIARLEESGTSDQMTIASFHELAGTLLGNSGAFAESIVRFRQVYDIQTRVEAVPALIASTHAKLAISHAKLDEKEAAKQELDSARELLRTASPVDSAALSRLAQIEKEYDL